MRDWFEWNGTRCTAYGIHVSEQPSITLPKPRVSSVTVPGHPGTLTLTDGTDVYEDITLTVECFVSNAENINAIGAWLKGSGTVRFANRPDGYYRATISNQIPFDKVIRGKENRTFKLQLKCRPFFNIDTAADITMNAPGNRITNPYGFEAYPLITLYGTGSNINLIIGDSTVMIDELDGNITIDTEAFLAYKQTDTGLVNACSSVTMYDDNWPVLSVGSTMVNWTPTSGTIGHIEIKPRWRCL